MPIHMRYRRPHPSTAGCVTLAMGLQVVSRLKARHSRRAGSEVGSSLTVGNAVQIPLDRLLLETDSPDGLLHQHADAHLPLPGQSPAQKLNHPANVRSEQLLQLCKPPSHMSKTSAVFPKSCPESMTSDQALEVLVA